MLYGLNFAHTIAILSYCKTKKLTLQISEIELDWLITNENHRMIMTLITGQVQISRNTKKSAMRKYINELIKDK